MSLANKITELYPNLKKGDIIVSYDVSIPGISRFINIYELIKIEPVLESKPVYNKYHFNSIKSNISFMFTYTSNVFYIIGNVYNNNINYDEFLL